MANETNTKCFFRYDDGYYCKRWAQRGSRFCHAHQPQGLSGPGHGPGNGNCPGGWPMLHPFARLATPNDLFDLVRESLSALRMGSMTPAQAAGICSLSAMWLKLYEKLEHHERVQALNAQILPSLVDAESAAHLERVERATAETDRQAAIEAELNHIVQFGPRPETDDPAAPAQPDSSDPPQLTLEEAQAKGEAMLAGKAS